MKNETPQNRKERKALHMAQLSRHGMGMETAEDIADWDKKFEDANPLPEEKKIWMHENDESECIRCKKLGNTHYNKFVFKLIVQNPDYKGSYECKACGDVWHSSQVPEEKSQCCEKCFKKYRSGLIHCMNCHCSCHSPQATEKETFIPNPQRTKGMMNKAIEKECKKNPFKHTITHYNCEACEWDKKWLLENKESIYPPIPSPNSWEEEFDKSFFRDTTGERVDGYLLENNFNGTVSIARPDALKSFISKTVETATQKGFNLGKESGLSQNIVYFKEREKLRQEERQRVIKFITDYRKIVEKRYVSQAVIYLVIDDIITLIS